MRTAYPYLQELQDDYNTGKDNYLHANYDTYLFYPSFTEDNVLTMVRNTFAEAMNRRIKLPSTVVILISDQLIVEDPLYLPSEVDRKIKWILRELDAMIKIRKSTLPTKAYKFGQPRIMWVRGFNNTMANYLTMEILLKYNNMLRKICMAKAVYTIATPSFNEAVPRCFDRDGKTQIKEGFKLLWFDIIEGIKRHDQADKRAEINQILRYNAHESASHTKSSRINRGTHSGYAGRSRNDTHFASSRTVHNSDDRGSVNQHGYSSRSPRDKSRQRHRSRESTDHYRY